MKLPQIIAELKAAIANDCATVTLEGRMIGVRRSPFDTDPVGLASWFEGRLVAAGRPATIRYGRMDLVSRWGIENWTDMDYAIFGDGRTRRQKWLRKWLLREFGLGGGVKSSDRVWMEAANA